MNLYTDTDGNGQQPEAPLFKRDDWTLFRNIATLGQRAGVAPDSIPKLVCKELVDNAIDSAGSCNFNRNSDGWLSVQDDGPGLPGTDADIADLFSVSRPLSSSKLLRLPTRGALGNGLRVVVGAVLSSGGELIVKTRGRALRLRPRDSDGGTDVERIGPWDGTGTCIEVLLGESLPVDKSTLDWARRARVFANVDGAKNYDGKTSCWWFDSDSFYELLQAAGKRTLRDLLADFDGCSRLKSIADDFGKCDTAVSSLTRDDADRLLEGLREATKPVKAKRLGRVGREFRPDWSYAAVEGTLEAAPARGRLSADIPCVVEVWATPSKSPHIAANVNRTPITAEVTMTRGMDDKTLYAIFGCGLSEEHLNTATAIKAGRGREYRVVVNVTTPYMPITSDGKAPDLSKITGDLKSAIEKAIRIAKRKAPKASKNDAIPRQKRGRPSPEAKAEYEARVEEFAQRIRQINSTLDFRPSTRGYCYILENEGVITKADFAACQKLITACRKNGVLDLDVCCEDMKRQYIALEQLHNETPEEYARRQVVQLITEVPLSYSPVSLWEDKDCYVQMLVEKIDLQQLFLPVCERFHIPIGNAGGWSDLNSRADLMRRFAHWETEGKQCVLLYAGDFDPGGVRMSDTLMSNLQELSGAVGWDPSDIIIDRFCLNRDFIEEHGISWIDGLITSSGKDLASPKHKDHYQPYVQDWLRDIGPRKVEANALVTAPEAGRELCRQAITKYVPADAPAQFESRVDLEREKVCDALQAALRMGGQAS